MLPAIGVIARFGASLASGMGRMTSMMGGAVARGAAKSAASGASNAVKNTATSAASSASSSASASGVKMGSNALDKFIKSQTKMNKLSDKSNIENMKYMNRFEMSLRRQERLMYRMNKYSGGIRNAFGYMSNAFAGIGLYKVLSESRGGRTEESFRSKAVGLNQANLKALRMAGRTINKNIDPVAIAQTFKYLAQEALTTPGSKGSLILGSSGLRLSPGSLKNMDELTLLTTVLKSINMNKSNVNLMENIQEVLGGISNPDLIQYAKSTKEIESNYYKYRKEINEKDEKALTELEKRRLDRENKMEIAMDNFAASFSKITDWWEDLWNKIKIGFLDTVLSTYNGIATAWNNIAKWWNEKSFTPGKLGLIPLAESERDKKERIKKEKEEEKRKSALEKRRIENEKSFQKYGDLLNNYVKSGVFDPDSLTGQPINFDLELQGLNTRINRYEDKTKYSTQETISNIQKIIDDYFSSSRFILLSNQVENLGMDPNNLRDALFASMLKDSLGWSEFQMPNDKYNRALGDLERGESYKDIIVKVYQNSYDVSSQGTSIQSKYK